MRLSSLSTFSFEYRNKMSFVTNRVDKTHFLLLYLGKNPVYT